MRALLLTALLVLPAIAGCLSDGDSDLHSATGTDTPGELFDFLNATMPTGQGARDLIASYVMTHPFRLHGQATQTFMDAARDDLEAELKGYGQYVVRQEYTTSSTSPVTPADGGVNILAIQNGTTNPEQWVVLSAHYDTVGAGGLGPTVYGAWDDGSGTALLMEMAKTMVDWKLPFTVVFAFFDGEEKGLVGSRHFMSVFDPSEQDEVDIVANLNTDPPGLNWPCGQMPLGHFPVKIIHQMPLVEDGAHPRYSLLFDAVEHGLNASGVPMEVRDYTPGIPIAYAAGTGVSGGSDHQSFGNKGVANVFLGGTPTTFVGGTSSDDAVAAALTYPLHTPLDTLEAMEARCVTGSLAGGLQTIATTMSHAVMYLAKHEIPERGVIE